MQWLKNSGQNDPNFLCHLLSYKKWTLVLTVNHFYNFYSQNFEEIYP